MLNKCRFLLTVINLLQQTTRQLSLDTLSKRLESQRLQLEAIIETLSKEQGALYEKKFDGEYTAIKKIVRQVLEVIVGVKRGSETLYANVISELYQAIELDNAAKVSELIKAGQRLFINGIALNEINATRGTFLEFAVGKKLHGVVKILLEHGAKPNLFVQLKRAPLRLAIKNECHDTLAMLLDYGAKIDEKALYKAIKTGNLSIVQLLVNRGASLKPTPGTLISGKTSKFNSPLKLALQLNHLEIAQFFIAKINENPRLWHDTLNHFLSYAPLDLLQEFLTNQSFSTTTKLATIVVTQVDRDNAIATSTSGEILLKRLLKKTSEPGKRLTLLKSLMQLLFTLDYFPSNLEKESCYSDRELIKNLSQANDNSPVKELASSLHQSMQAASQQGVVAAGYRVLFDVLVFAGNHNIGFSDGVELINKVVIQVHTYHQDNKSWPSLDKVNLILDEEIQKIESVLVNSPNLEKNDEKPCEESTIRFQAMVGGEIFAKLNPHLPVGGQPTKAGRWFKNILSILVNTMEESKLLSEDWSEEKAQQLLQDICKSSSGVSIANDSLKPQAIGFNLRMPDHFIPGVLFSDTSSWRYTVICRSFLQPSNQSNRGAVEFIIPSKYTSQLPFLIKDVTKRRSHEYIVSESAKTREIEHRLLQHFLMIEKLTGLRGRYSEHCAQKAYKLPTCYISNIKPLLQLLVITMAKSTATEQQWQQYNETLKTLILKEMSKANVCLEQFKFEEKIVSAKKYSEQQKTYKLISILSRWSEINLFSPKLEEEIRGKEATLNHVGEHTIGFFP
ncbi:ankyrin repeat domain-containing protein [Legionella hackeliae]|uniref:Uncharacterized protein n=1 Tax=Legionella hackeliae TaxID=449 RepID=A0A0A8UT53_LEGHA|nr:ankyrin repeat domain-containing protein [Legionella hackeliae]KTD11501.1 Ankyrin repeats (3 copies) [Legionella hackeliae]CEK10666.1 protein of unknown function [ankyrin domain] [Legionella hackeliae]STX47412.1 Ankyrin repeats (3 copies) [Legionella hackeliae]